MRAAHLGDSSLFIAHMWAVYPGSSSLCENVILGRLQPLSSPRWGLYCENLQLHSIPSSFILPCDTFEGYMHGQLQARKVKHDWWALSCQHNTSKKLQPHLLPWWPKQFWVALAHLIISISTGCLGVPSSLYVIPRSLQTHPSSSEGYMPKRLQTHMPPLWAQFAPGRPQINLWSW